MQVLRCRFPTKATSSRHPRRSKSPQVSQSRLRSSSSVFHWLFRHYRRRRCHSMQQGRHQILSRSKLFTTMHATVTLSGSNRLKTHESRCHCHELFNNFYSMLPLRKGSTIFCAFFHVFHYFT